MNINTCVQHFVQYDPTQFSISSSKLQENITEEMQLLSTDIAWGYQLFRPSGSPIRVPMTIQEEEPNTYSVMDYLAKLNNLAKRLGQLVRPFLTIYVRIYGEAGYEDKLVCFTGAAIQKVLSCIVYAQKKGISILSLKLNVRRLGNKKGYEIDWDKDKKMNPILFEPANGAKPANMAAIFVRESEVFSNFSYKVDKSILTLIDEAIEETEKNPN
jgi:hypothetical protein